MDLRIPAGLLLLAVGGVLSREADRLRATPPPPPGPTAVLGGFAALAAQAIWIRADRAVLHQDEDRAVALLRTLVDLEPQVVSAARYAAQEIGWNMLDGRDDPAARWSLSREAVRILSECVDRNPGSAAARGNRGRYLWLKVSKEPALDAAYRRDVDPRGAAAAALDDFERALDLEPDEPEAEGGLPAVGRDLGVAAVEAGRWDDAERPLRQALRGLDAFLSTVRREMGDAVTRPGPEAEAYAQVLEGRAAIAALLDVVEAPAGRRESLLEAFREAHPGIVRSR